MARVVSEAVFNRKIAGLKRTLSAFNRRIKIIRAIAYRFDQREYNMHYQRELRRKRRKENLK